MRLDADLAAFPPDAVLRQFGAEKDFGGLAKVVHVLLHVEPDEVAAEQAAHELARPRQDAKHLHRGPRDVPKVGDRALRERLADVLWQQHQVIVLHPDRIVRSGLLQHGFGEAAVDAAVVLDEGTLEGEVPEEVMRDRPQHAVGHPLVVVVPLFVGHRHAADREVGGVGGIGLMLRLVVLPHRHPHAAVLLEHGQKGRRQPADRGLPLAVGELHGCPVGDDDQSV